MAPGLRDGDTWNLGVQPASTQPLAPGGRQEGAPAQGLTTLLSAPGRTGRAPAPHRPGLGGRWTWSREGQGPGGTGESHPGPPYAAFCSRPTGCCTGYARLPRCGYAVFCSPSHRLPHPWRGPSSAVGTADRSAGEGYGLVAWVGKAAAPDPILGEMEGSSWVWLLPREAGESPIQLGHVLSSQRPLPAQPNCPAHGPL